MDNIEAVSSRIAEESFRSRIAAVRATQEFEKGAERPAISRVMDERVLSARAGSASRLEAGRIRSSKVGSVHGNATEIDEGHALNAAFGTDSSSPQCDTDLVDEDQDAEELERLERQISMMKQKLVTKAQDDTRNGRHLEGTYAAPERRASRLPLGRTVSSPIARSRVSRVATSGIRRPSHHRAGKKGSKRPMQQRIVGLKARGRQPLLRPTITLVIVGLQP